MNISQKVYLNPNTTYSASIKNLSAHPVLTTKDSGFKYWNTVDKTPYVWDGTKWNVLVESNYPDKHIKIKLEQEINTLEFLSIKISSDDIYQSFNADYGVLIGRIIANNGIGVPNAKVSIFIPLSDEDELDDNIRYIYPYKTPRDKNNMGKRYNLLPRVGRIDPKTNISKPIQPFGSFPIKEEIVTNIDQLNVYKKYYKYTALTNDYGDYMIFGAPIGTQIIHMSLDITDIGKYSMTPASMIANLGYSPNLFTKDGTRVKENTDLNDLPHIETQEITVDIIPFWGDVENFEVGITRQDFRVKTTINNTITIFGSAFTDGAETMWGSDKPNNESITPSELYYIGNSEDLNILTKRGVKIKESIYYYPMEISDNEIGTSTDISDSFKNESDMKLLDKSEYSRYINEDGTFVFIINCNRRKKITNTQNELIDVDNAFNGGIFTEFKGFIIFEADSDSSKMEFKRYLDGGRGRVEQIRYKLKFPQDAAIGKTFNSDDNRVETKLWKKKYETFIGGEIYSVSRYHGLVHNSDDQTYITTDPVNGITTTDTVDNLFTSSTLKSESVYNVGIIQSPAESTSNTYFIPTGIAAGTVMLLGDPRFVAASYNPVVLDIETLNTYKYKFTGNETMLSVYLIDITTKGLLYPNDISKNYFGAEWLNMAIYFPQIGVLKNFIGNNDDVRSCSHFTSQYWNNTFYYEDNNQEIAAGEINTKWFGRSDINKTAFIRISKMDLDNFFNQEFNGFILPVNSENNYKHKSTVHNYFYKGFGTDSLKFLKKIGIV